MQALPEYLLPDSVSVAQDTIRSHAFYIAAYALLLREARETGVACE